MKRFLLLNLLLATMANMLFAQKKLTNSRTSGYYTYLYKLTDKETFEVASKSNAVINNNYLHTLIDSFYNDSNKKYNKKLPFGNYLYVTPVKNQLKYQLVPVANVALRFVNNGKDFQFTVTDLKGNSISTATVKAGKGKTVKYNAQAKLYVANKGTKVTVITVNYNGVNSYFTYDQDKEIKPIRSGYKVIKDKKPDYAGYIVFNKPWYKPSDTVKFKAYLVTAKGAVINKKPLRVDLQGLYGDLNRKTLTILNPYREGGYEYSFVIADSLNLKLDQSYAIVLNEKSGKEWKPVLSSSFRYEDYELKSVNFSVRTDKEEQRPGNPLTIFMKATDENELAVPDGRVEVIVKNNDVSEFYNNKVFVKDTLWQTNVILDPVGETKLTLPDSIFPKANVYFSVEFIFLNSNNERRVVNKSLKYIFENERNIKSTFKQDSLYLEYLVKGKSASQKVVVYTSFPNGNDQDSVQIELPATIKIDYHASGYLIKTTNGYKKYISPVDFRPDLRIVASQSKNALHVSVNNEHRMPFWYTIFSDNKVLLRGYTNQLDTLITHTSAKAAYVRINYIWNEKEIINEVSAFYSPQLLNVKLLAPDIVYPGQTVNMQVKVTDIDDRPVAATDVTAYAFTAKFENVKNVLLPNFGKWFSPRKQSLRIQGDDMNQTGDMKLAWDKWGKELGLDTIEYYKFTQIKERYAIQEDCDDTMALVAPFVVKDGKIEPAHIIYIDEIPVFFDQADQLQRYAFRIKPGLHTIQLRTTGYLVRLDNYNFVKGKKTIISIAANTSNTKATIKVMPDSLTDHESSLLTKYIIRISNNFNNQKSILSAGNVDLLLNPPGKSWNKELLIAPLSENYLRFRSASADQTFLKQPGYTYTFLPGLLKQSPYTSKYGFNKHLSLLSENDNYKQYPLKSGEIDSLWNDYLDLRSHTTPLFNNYSYTQDNTYGKLVMKLDTTISKAMPYVKNMVIYKYDEPDFLMVYPGNTTFFSPMEMGEYRIMYLFKDNRYFVVEHVAIKPNGLNYFKWQGITIHQADSLSCKIDQHIKSVNNNIPSSSSQAAEKIRMSLNNKYFKSSALTNIMSGRVIDSKDKSPLSGVSIKVKGLEHGVVTDENGRFEIKTPQKGKLLILFIGYNTKEIDIKKGSVKDIVLEARSNSLAGVEITKEREIRLNDMLESSPGLNSSIITIRGTSLAGGQKPLVFVDGLPFSDDINTLDPATVASIEVLTDKEAIAIYGSKGKNGIIIVKTKNGNARLNTVGEQTEQQQTMRTNFSDYAIWQPKLITDEEGKAKFTVKFPDDITSWTTRLIAMNGKKQGGISETSIRSFKILSANFVSPLFAMAGDSINVIGKLMNYNNTDESVIRRFNYNGVELLNSAVKFKNAHIDTVTIVAKGVNNSVDGDSLKFEYTMKQDNGYFDGEVRKIPLLQAGITESKGYFNALTTDTTITYKFDPALGKVSIMAEASIFPFLLDEMEKLKQYEYLSNEQLASKLKALLLEKMLRKHLHEDFREEKNIKSLIKKLNERKLPAETWGWWQNSNEELWISLHVSEALLQAQKQGYAIILDKDKLYNYLVSKLAGINNIDQVYAVKLLHLLNKNYYIKDWIMAIEKQQQSGSYKWPLYKQLQMMQLKQQAGMSVDLKWLLARKKETMFGNIYWGEDNNQFWDNSIQNTLLAYQILKSDGHYKEDLSSIQRYFLEQRRNGQWRNTYESSLILETILPELITAGQKPEPASIVLNKTETITKFPFSRTITPSTLIIDKKGNAPVYFSAYQQFNNVKPEKVNKDFMVKTWFDQNGIEVQNLKAGKLTTLKVEIEVSADADYVMIEIPIPAGCSYENKLQSFWGIETHREYFKHKTSIFCTKLKKGKYNFSISLMPRYSGNYIVNPAKAEMMYFPIFYGREGMKRVVVKN